MTRTDSRPALPDSAGDLVIAVKRGIRAGEEILLGRFLPYTVPFEMQKLPTRGAFLAESARSSYLERLGQARGDTATPATKARKMKPETGRVEKRFATAVSVRVASLDRLWLVEPATTENVSLFGARILVKSIWRADERAVIEFPGGVDPCQARVIYCQVLKSGGAAIGVRLARARPDWTSRGRMG